MKHFLTVCVLSVASAWISVEAQETLNSNADSIIGMYYVAHEGEESKVENILRSIYDYYVKHTERLPAIYKAIADEEGVDRAACDYVSGMTDKYAMYQYSELFIPAAWQLR